MKAVITHDQLQVQNEVLYNSGSIDYYEIDVEFTSDWDNLTKYAIINGAEAVKIPVVANKVKVDRNTSGTYYIGFVGYTIDDNEKTYQISTNLQPIYFQIGAGELPAADPQDLPDPTTWEAYLNEIQSIVDGAENVNITSEKIEDTTYITTTDKTGTATTTEITDGKDAKINGVNTITIEGGENVTIEQEGNTLTISATDTTDYTELSNKPSINGVELSGNKTSADLNIKQTYNKSDVGLGNVDNVRQYSASNPPPYPVNSVNGQTGAVVIDTHDDLIPTQASSSNQLADKNFVNSTVGTATATFRGTYNSLAELEQVTADENDYGFVVSTDSAGNTVYNRYKYASGTWTFEYALNNSSFTQAQWEAIQSGITSGLVTKLQGIEANAEVNIVEGVKIGNVTQTVTNKIVGINPDTTPTQGSSNVIDSNAIYEVEKLLPTDTANGENVDIDNAQPYKVLDIVADGKYQQDTTSGKNLFSGFTIGVALNNSTGGTYSSDVSATSDYIPIDFNTNSSYFLSGLSDTLHSNIWAYNSSKQGLGRTGNVVRTDIELTSNVFTNGTPQGTGDIAYIRICHRVDGADTGTMDIINSLKVQLEQGSTATSYEPYTGGIPSPNPNYPQTITQVTSAVWNRTDENNTNTQSITIDLDGNEVCAVSNTIKDKLLVDRYGNVAIQKNVGKSVLDGSEAGWTKSPSFSGAYYRTQARFGALGAGNPFICNYLTFVDSTSNFAIGKCANNNNYLFWFGDGTTYPDVESFKTMLSTLYNNNTPVIVYYALATPTIIPLPKLSILPTTLKGINHIWLDTNLGRTQIEVEYVKDLEVEIQALQQAIENIGG